ncbi:MAG TPA: NAD-dependent epimerase/dehydratase family protein [Herpetosiphonaceae bacterium]
MFVTGGTGFLGARLIQRLVREGHQVRALARSASSAEMLRHLGAQPVHGSLDNVAEWADSLRGQDVVIHCAAPVEFWGPWEKFHREITLATRQLLDHAARMQVGRFIYISSESVLQDTTPLVGIDETFPYPAEPNSYYGKAKKLAEIEVVNHRSEMTCIILRPTYIWGKGEKTSKNIEDKIKAGQFAWIDQGRCIIEMVHVDNVVEAIMLACAVGRDKQIYFVTDDAPVSFREFFTALLATRGIVPPSRSLPQLIARPAATLAEGIWRGLRLKSPPPLSRFEWSFVALPRAYKLNKIKQELGYRPIVSREMGLQEMQAHANEV